MGTAEGPIDSTKEFPMFDPLEICTIRVGSLTFKSVEACFLSAMYEEPSFREDYAKCEDGWEARELYEKLHHVAPKIRKDWAVSLEVGSDRVPGYVEVLRRVWFLRFIQDPEARKELMATEYRPFRLSVSPSSVKHEQWISDRYLNDVLTIVRAQLRNLSSGQLSFLDAGNVEAAFLGVGRPADEKVPANVGVEDPYLDLHRGGWD